MTARIGISSYPAVIYFIFLVFSTMTTIYANTLALSLFFRVIVYGFYLFRLICTLWFLLAIWAKLMGKIDILDEKIQGIYMPYRSYSLFSYDLSEIKTISVSHGIFGRSFNYGTLRLHFADKSIWLPFIRNPAEVKEYIYSQSSGTTML